MVLCSQQEELTTGWLTKHTPICILMYRNVSASHGGSVCYFSSETKNIRFTNDVQSHVVAVRGGWGAILHLGQVTDLCIFLMEKH